MGAKFRAILGGSAGNGSVGPVGDRQDRRRFSVPANRGGLRTVLPAQPNRYQCASCFDERDARPLGHTQVQTAARYAHLAGDPVQAAAEQVTSSIAAILNSGLAQDRDADVASA